MALLQELMVKDKAARWIFSALGDPAIQWLGAGQVCRTGLVHKRRRGAAAVYGWVTNRVCRVYANS